MQPFLHLIFVALGLLLTGATLPLLLELLTLSIAALFPPPPEPAPAAEPMRLAVVIPAHNEEALIAKCVASLAAGPSPGHSIFVVAHNCTDSTAERALDAGATVLILDDSVGGKGAALDFGLRNAIEGGADILLVVDADSIATPGLTSAVWTAFAGGAQAVQCRYQVANSGANRRTRLAALAFLGMNVLRPRGRHRLGLSCGIFGNGFALSAATLARVPYTPNSLVEDLEYHLHLIRAGIRVEFLDRATVLGEMPETNAAAASQRARWEGGRILMRRIWTRPLALEILRGRLRMLEPLLDLLALPLATEGALLLLALVVSVPVRLDWLTAYAALGIATLIFYIVVAATLGPEPIASLQALVSAPAFLVWKLMMIARTRLAARTDAAWVRTQRNAESVEQKDPPA